MVSLLGALIPTPNPVLLQRYLGDGGDGPTYSDPEPFFGRWEDTTSQKATAEGRVVTITGLIYLPAAVDPKAGDQLAKATAPDTWHRVEFIDTATWFDGSVMHHEVRVS